MPIRRDRNGRFISRWTADPTPTIAPPPEMSDTYEQEYDEGPEPYAYCHACGDGVDEENCWAGGDRENYCESCYDERWTTCEQCDNSISRDQIIVHDSGVRLCPDCNDNHSFTCHNCGEVQPTCRAHEVDSHDYCQSCSRGALRCQNCNGRSFVRSNFVIFEHPQEGTVTWCTACKKTYFKNSAPKAIRCFYCETTDYARNMMTKEVDMLSGKPVYTCPRCKSSKNARRMIRAVDGLPEPTRVIVKRPYGVEIEANNAYSRQLLAQQFGFIVVRDGSVASHTAYSGMNGELVSPVMTDDSSLTVIRHVMDSGIVADRSCGYHLHVAPIDYDWFDIGKLIYWCKRFENRFEQMCPGRGGNSYCNRLPDFDADELLNSKRQMDIICNYFRIDKEVFSQVKKFRGGFNASCKTSIAYGASGIRTNRYMWVNMNSYIWRGTIEIRLHGGVSNSLDAISWIRLWQGIFEWVKKAGTVDIATADFSACFPTKKIRDFYYDRARAAYGDSACAEFSDVSVNLGKPCPKPLP